ncbi:MAG: hemoglobin [Flavobacteriales bacterium]|jgi:hemoglobin
MKEDFKSREDVNLMVKTFYESVFEDVMLAPIFITSLGDDLEPHYSRMTDFWEDQVLGSFKFEGNPMKVHMELSQHFKMDNDLFDVWLNLFTSTVDNLFEGENADKAKQQAINIATVIRLKMKS